MNTSASRVAFGWEKDSARRNETLVRRDANGAIVASVHYEGYYGTYVWNLNIDGDSRRGGSCGERDNAFKEADAELERLGFRTPNDKQVVMK